jgi:hypothetical protein
MTSCKHNHLFKDPIPKHSHVVGTSVYNLWGVWGERTQFSSWQLTSSAKWASAEQFYQRGA